MAADRPGVLAEIAGILGKHEISIASVIQHDDERTADGFVPLVIMTHTATEADVQAAVETIDRTPSTGRSASGCACTNEENLKCRMQSAKFRL